MKHYKIINTTKQPRGVGRHKKGFFVAISAKTMIYPGQHTIIENLTPGVMGFQKCGYIKIETIDDINVELQKQIESIEDDNMKKRRALEAQLKDITNKKMDAKKDEVVKELREIEVGTESSVISSSSDKEAMKQAVRDSNEGLTKAIVSSGETGEDPLSDVEEAVSVDGEPNFIVQAGKAGKGKGKRK